MPKRWECAAALPRRPPPRARAAAAPPGRKPSRPAPAAAADPSIGVGEFIGCSLACGFDSCQYRCMSKSELPLTGVAASGCEATPPTRPPLTAETAVELAGMFKALADPVRLRLLSAIAARAGGEACVCNLSEGIDVTQPTISHHLKVLRE